MKYAELLNKYIESSGLSLGEIAKRLSEEKGISIDRSYISMLKNNKTKNPASEEVSRALAEITGGNPDDLVLAGYIDKAPLEVKTLIERADEYEKFFEELLKIVDLNIEVEGDPEQTRFFHDEKEHINSSEFLKNLDPYLRNFILFNVLTSLSEQAPNVFKGLHSKFSDVYAESNRFSRPVPLVGTICAGNGLLAEENIDGYVFYPNPGKRQPDFALRVKGNSMLGAGIDDGDIVYMKSANWAEYNGQIVAVIMREDDHGTLKRIRWNSETAHVQLIPENADYEIKEVLPNEISICGIYMGHFKPEKENQ